MVFCIANSFSFSFFYFLLNAKNWHLLTPLQKRAKRKIHFEKIGSNVQTVKKRTKHAISLQNKARYANALTLPYINLLVRMDSQGCP